MPIFINIMLLVAIVCSSLGVIGNYYKLKNLLKKEDHFSLFMVTTGSIAIGAASILLLLITIK
jgi:hypothetical protein